MENIKKFSCFICENKYSSKIIPKLVCGHFICSPCYVDLKTQFSHCAKCSICNKFLRRR